MKSIDYLVAERGDWSLQGKHHGGELDEGDPASGYRGALVPVMAGEGEAGIDHVIAGWEGFVNPANKDGDIQMEGWKRYVIESLGSKKIVAGEAVTWEGDLGGVVFELFKHPVIGLDAAYNISMPRQDLEGDILAAVLDTQIMVEDKVSLVEGLRLLYDPEQPYYNNRYTIFAEEIFKEFVPGDTQPDEITIKDIIDPQTGKLYPVVREAFLNIHLINVRNYGIGLVVSEELEGATVTDIKELIDDFSDDPEEKLRELGADLGQINQYASNVMDLFLTDLEERLKQAD